MFPHNICPWNLKIWFSIWRSYAWNCMTRINCSVGCYHEIHLMVLRGDQKGLLKVTRFEHHLSAMRTRTPWPRSGSIPRLPWLTTEMASSRTSRRPTRTWKLLVLTSPGSSMELRARKYSWQGNGRTIRVSRDTEMLWYWIVSNYMYIRLSVSLHLYRHKDITHKKFLFSSYALPIFSKHQEYVIPLLPLS